MPTAGTDGRDVYYDPKFIDSLNDRQLRFVVAHEAMHKALLHLLIHQGLVKKLAVTYGTEQARRTVNVAQDYVINRDLMRSCVAKDDKEPFMEAPNCPFAYDPKYNDDMVWDTIKIVEDIVKNSQGGGGGGSGSGQQSHDHHDWEAAQELTEAEAKGVVGQIEQALRQGRELSRKLGGNVSRSIEDLLTPAVDWRQALRDFVVTRARGNECFTYSRPTGASCLRISHAEHIFRKHQRSRILLRHQWVY